MQDEDADRPWGMVRQMPPGAGSAGRGGYINRGCIATRGDTGLAGINRRLSFASMIFAKAGCLKEAPTGNNRLGFPSERQHHGGGGNVSAAISPR